MDWQNQPESDLIDFLKYLIYINRQSKINASNNSELEQDSVHYKSIYSLDDYSSAEENQTSPTNDLDTNDLFLKDLPVALIQLFILIFVFLIIFCMCKCNRLLNKLREQEPKTQEELMEEMYHDKKRLVEYCSNCCLFVQLKFILRRIFCLNRTNRKSSDERNFRRNRFVHKNLSDGLFRRKTKHKQSAIFKRRAVIYRNKTRTYKVNANAYAVSNNKPDEAANQSPSMIARAHSPVVSFIPSYVLKQQKEKRKNSFSILNENKNALNQKIQIINESISV
jgi:hypothetical protein